MHVHVQLLILYVCVHMHCSAYPRVLGEAGHEAGELGVHGSESLH